MGISLLTLSHAQSLLRFLILSWNPVGFNYKVRDKLGCCFLALGIDWRKSQVGLPEMPRPSRALKLITLNRVGDTPILGPPTHSFRNFDLTFDERPIPRKYANCHRCASPHASEMTLA